MQPKPEPEPGLTPVARSACDPKPLNRSRQLGDIYGKWQGGPNWHFGNRMNDRYDVHAAAIGSGFGFDGLPYHEIVAEEGATKLNFFEDEQALPHGAQIRFRFPKLSPNNAQTATVVWEAKYDPRAYAGGKAYQLAINRKINIENTVIMDSDPMSWLMIPATRVYGKPKIGGNGERSSLSSGPWPQRNIQPALNAPGRNYDYCYSRDHVNGTSPRAFIVVPGQWYRYIYTIDWRTEPHRLWLWMESEDTPRTLLLADETDNSQGFILQFKDSQRSALDEFWFEFNNSRSRNSADFSILVRNFFVLKDVLGGEL